MMERDGELKTEVVQNVKRSTLGPIMQDTIKEGSVVYTDELKSYNHLNLHGYKHSSVKHGVGEYAKGDCHVNSLEGHWSLFKRSIRGTHVHISKQHMHKYLSEFDFRHNTRKTPEKMFSRLMELLREEQPA